MFQQDASYQNLKVSLVELVRLYTHLFDVVTEEKQLLIQCDLKLIQEQNLKKEALLTQIDFLEKTREANSMALATFMQVSKPLTLLELASLIGNEEEVQLRAIHQALQLTVQRVSEGNRENAILAKSALVTIQNVMRAMRGVVQSSPTYMNKGVLNNSKPQEHHLISKEA